MDILMLKPGVKREIWGGTKLITEYGFRTDRDNIAEAWMLSCQDKYPSVVDGGAYDGKTLAEVIAAEGKKILGRRNADKDAFPILIKLIDAQKKLSIQVHPDDEYAHKKGQPYGKTEAWYIVGAEPGAELIYGANRDLTPAEFAESIADNTVVENLNRVPVKPGDVAFIPAKTIHAIGAGVLLAEVQQNSDTTYRIYDYDRRDDSGAPRELHVEDAKLVANLDKTEADFSPKGGPVKKYDATATLLAECAFFTMTAVEVDGKYRDFAGEDGFTCLIALDGEGEIKGGDRIYPMKKGSCAFIPAGFGDYSLRGKMKLLKTDA